MSRYWALLPAAGSGRRMGAAVPKQYLKLAGRAMIAHALQALLEHPRIDGAVVVLAADDRHWAALAIDSEKPLLTATGGVQRWQSVQNGLRVLRNRIGGDDWVLVHDAARPCIRREDLDLLIGELADDPVGGLLAAPVYDTLKRAVGGRVAATVDRRDLWRAMTPQMFRFGVLWQAFEAIAERGLEVTDEAAAVETLGHAPRLLAGRSDNLKITRPEELVWAEYFLYRQQELSD